MATTYLRLPYEGSVLRPGSLTAVRLAEGPVGFALEVGLNYYRGLPLSAVERFELTVDEERVADHLLLFEYNRKLFPLSQLGGAFTEFWSLKRPLRVLVYNGGLAAGEHRVEVTLILRSVYMQFAPGVWGMIDGSAARTLTLEEAA
nr:DUF6379 domain-containing protein [Microbacterium bovistercoris]